MADPKTKPCGHSVHGTCSHDRNTKGTVKYHNCGVENSIRALACKFCGTIFYSNIA